MRARARVRPGGKRRLLTSPARRRSVSWSAVVPRGSVIDSLFGIINEGDADVVVYSVAGSLNNELAFEQYLQNVRPAQNERVGVRAPRLTPPRPPRPVRSSP